MSAPDGLQLSEHVFCMLRAGVASVEYSKVQSFFLTKMIVHKHISSYFQLFYLLHMYEKGVLVMINLYR